jgi:CheY-like chemotaxis protein
MGVRSVVGPWLSQNGARPVALVVEEMPMLRAHTQELLERIGFDVVVAGDGPSAIALSRRHAGDIDLLLTDAVMPGMQGFELAEAIREERPRVTVVYMSRHDAFGHGMAPAALVAKPVEEAQLVEVLREHLPGHLTSAD